MNGAPSDVSAAWSQDSPGIVGEAEGSDDFGQALGWADFDGDGLPDLAVGTGMEKIVGAVNVM